MELIKILRLPMERERQLRFDSEATGFYIPYPTLLRRMIRKRKRRKPSDLVVVDITERSQ